MKSILKKLSKITFVVIFSSCLMQNNNLNAMEKGPSLSASGAMLLGPVFDQIMEKGAALINYAGKTSAFIMIGSLLNKLRNRVSSGIPTPLPSEGMELPQPFDFERFMESKAIEISDSAKNFVNNHKWKFIVSGGIGATTFITYKVLKNLINKAKNLTENKSKQENDKNVINNIVKVYIDSEGLIKIKEHEISR